MDNAQIISTLSEKLGTTNLSAQTIATYVANNLLGEGGEYDDAYYDKHVNILKSLQGQFNHDVASQINSFKAEWEKNHPTQQNTPPQPQEPPRQTPSDANKALLDRMEKLEKALLNAQKKNSADALVAEVVGKANTLGVTNAYLWGKAVRSIDIEDGMTSDQVLEKAKGIYETELKAILGNGAYPYGNSNTPNPKDAQKELDKYFDLKKSQGKF